MKYACIRSEKKRAHARFYHGMGGEDLKKLITSIFFFRFKRDAPQTNLKDEVGTLSSAL